MPSPGGSPEARTLMTWTSAHLQPNLGMVIDCVVVEKSRRVAQRMVVRKRMMVEDIDIDV